jgi:hypothetical protein
VTLHRGGGGDRDEFAPVSYLQVDPDVLAALGPVRHSHDVIHPSLL